MAEEEFAKRFAEDRCRAPRAPPTGVLAVVPDGVDDEEEGVVFGGSVVSGAGRLVRGWVAVEEEGTDEAPPSFTAKRVTAGSGEPPLPLDHTERPADVDVPDKVDELTGGELDSLGPEVWKLAAAAATAATAAAFQPGVPASIVVFGRVRAPIGGGLGSVAAGRAESELDE